MGRKRREKKLDGGERKYPERRRALQDHPHIYISFRRNGWVYGIEWKGLDEETGKKRSYMKDLPGFSLERAKEEQMSRQLAANEELRFAAKDNPMMRTLFADAIRRARDAKRRPSTLAGYESAVRLHLNPALGDRRVRSVEVDDVVELIAELRAKGLAENSIADIIKPLQKALFFARRDKMIADDPFELLVKEERPRRPRPRHRILTATELERLAEACHAEGNGIGVAVGFGYFLGPRTDEALRCRVHDFDRDTLVIRLPGLTKTEAGIRTLHAFRDRFEFLDALRDHVELRGLSETDYLIRGPEGGRYDRHNFTKHYNRVVVAAGLKVEGLVDLSYQQLRHNFAAVAARMGIDLSVLLKQMGHAHITSLQPYLGYYDEPPLDPQIRDRITAAARLFCQV